MTTYAITGANRGIGLELARLALGAGHEVLALCRTPSEALLATGASVLDGIDVADDAVATTLARRLEGKTIDVVINNAGVLIQAPRETLDVDGIRTQFEVNALGPLRVTRGMHEALHSGAKVVIITSRMGSLADNTSGGSYGYRMSKAAVNMAGVSLAHDLKPRGIAVALIHPGFVKTDMTSGNGAIEAAEAAAGILARIDELTMASTGRFWHQNGESLPW